MKQLETHTRTIGENTFYIRPFPAFRAANLSGELASLLLPAAAAFAGTDGGGNPLDMQLSDVSPAISSALASLSGDKVEEILVQLLISGRNISVETAGKAQLLTQDTADELFCGSVEEMYLLAVEVIKLNFGGFFSKLADRSGGGKSAGTAIYQNTANLI